MQQLNPEKLIADTRRARFLAELADHSEDMGNNSALGSTDLLAEYFNTYAMPRHRTRIIIIIAIAVITFITPVSMFAQLHQGPDNLAPWQGILGIPSMIIMVPVLLPFIVISETVGIPDGTSQLVMQFLLVAIASAFWTVVAYKALISPPKMFTSKS